MLRRETEAERRKALLLLLGHILQLNPTWKNKIEGALGQAAYCNRPYHFAQGL